MTLNLTTNTQKIRANATKILSMSFVILLLLSCAAIFSPLASGQVANLQRTFTTQTFMRISPNPTGLLQSATIFVFSGYEPAQKRNQPYFGWNFTVSVTTPSGDSHTYDMPMSLSTGYTYIGYTPTEIGDYKVQAHFPAVIVEYTSPGAGWGNWAVGNYSYLESYSDVQTLTVQEDEVIAWPGTPLPTDYWQFPITAENKLWSSIAGNWLYRATQNPGNPHDYTIGPKTAHILWTKPITIGGISGGELWGYHEDGLNYWTGLLYQKKFSPIIISGYLYYDINPPTENKEGINCVNLRTGELIWSDPDFPHITCGQVFTRIGGLGSGSLAYLWSTSAAVVGGGSTEVSGGTWSMYDAFNGQLLTQFVNATASGRNVSLQPYFGPSGELLVYVYQPAHNYLALWNSSIAFLGTPARASEGWSPWNPPLRDWHDGIQWNVTIPELPNNPSFRFVDTEAGVLVAEGNFDATSAINPTFNIVGYDANTGEQLWHRNVTDVGWGQGGPVGPGLMVFDWAFGEGKFAFFERETTEYHIIDIHTGIETAIANVREATHNDWSFYDWHPVISYGRLYTVGYSGAVCCFNLTTGANEWVFPQNNTGVETPYGTWPTYGTMTIGDGIVYVGFSQHTPATPMYRGYNLYAINATTGEQIWYLPFFADPSSLALAGGELLNTNGYDNQIYAFGKGLSATTVTAPQTGIQVGSTALITGTVTDQSPGQTSLGIPAAGTPAIADAYMTKWMEYMYQQQRFPDNAEGVEVVLTTLDPNGNSYEIGRTTSSVSSIFGCAFTPPVPGLYKITATFEGSNSYYGSYAETYINVEEAPTAAQQIAPEPTEPVPTEPEPTEPVPTEPVPTEPEPTEPEPTEPAEAPFITTEIAIIIAVVVVAVVGIVAFWMLRKRK